MTRISEGDEVRVFRRRLLGEHPEGIPGKVEGVGQRYAHVTFAEPWADPDGVQTTRERSIRFDLLTGHQAPSIDGYYVRTIERVKEDGRRREAIGWLGLAGLEFKIARSNFLTLEQLEQLAEVIKGWDLG